MFTSRDGLLSTSTQAIAQTSEGFIWIGGYGGLVRYDGRRFETFAYKCITRVTDLAAGQDGVLWAATSDKGLFRYKDNKFSSPGGEKVPDVECLAFSPEGKLYLGTDEGLCTVEEDQVRRLEIPGLFGECIERMIIPESDKILCIADSGVLYLWDGENLTKAASDEKNPLRSVCRILR